jgi:hypothetical protein
VPIDVAFPLPGLRDVIACDAAAVRLTLCTPRELADWWGDAADAVPLWTTRFPEGELVTVMKRGDSAQRIDYGEHARFGITPSGAGVLCAPSEMSDPRWRRFLLDTVLWWISSLRGFFLLHACALAGSGGVAAFASTTGGGKTTLALELVRRGWRVLSDDVVALDRRAGRIYAHPAPAVMNAPATGVALEALGVPVATIGDEVWLEVEAPEPAAQRLEAVVLYQRARGRPLRMERIAATPLDLAPHIWDARNDLERARERFDFVSDLVNAVALYKLEASLTTSPSEIAAAVDEALAGGETDPSPGTSPLV